MQIQKRTLAKYIALNCLTLGIYGFIVGRQMNDEIEAICKGDGQSPRFSYTATVLLCLIPIYGQTVGFLYYLYWWYQQANRLKMNAGRYGITVQESGTELFLMRTVLELPMIFVTIIEYVAAFLAPGLVVILCALIHPVLGGVFGFIFALIFYAFGKELTFGASISNYYVMKNLNRFAEVYGNGAKSYDPMGYEYYPSLATKYTNVLPNILGDTVSAGTDERQTDPLENDSQDTVIKAAGQLIGVKGSCAGYAFELASGEEVVIGKDAKMASVVIDPAYKEVSRKHVSICYDMTKDMYRVIDFSSNGTWANGEKLVSGQPVYLSHGSEIQLANGKNIFQLG